MLHYPGTNGGRRFPGWAESLGVPDKAFMCKGMCALRRQKELERWSSAKSRELYGIQSWSNGYFDISTEGEVIVCPSGKKGGQTVSLMDIISGMTDRGLNMPVLLRIEDILNSQITRLHTNFSAAIKEYGYQSVYRGVYPIKVNQQEQVVAEITSHGKQYHHGLEAGSKAELIAAISFIEDPDALVICNGYKDEEFIDLALHALKAGIQCILVIEIPGELPLIMERAKALGVRPCLGVRVKLASRAEGQWAESGGDNSVFGLNTAQIMDVVDSLRKQNSLDCLQLLHYHIGSQVPNIRDIREAVNEAGRIYAGLVAEGALMGYLDLGGGLAVDYDGSQTNFSASRNYSLQEYCSNIIEQVTSALDETGVAHPVIITESGRATVAYYSVLLFNILDVSRFETHEPPKNLPQDTHETLVNLFEIPKFITLKNAQECYHDAIYYRDELRQLFKHGVITLRERALGEQMFWHVMMRVLHCMQSMKHVPDELENLDNRLADIYYGNFSVFQSLPDAWAIDHLFPIMPIHRLNEAPTRNGIIADITCDCDGKIDRFIDFHDVKRTLPLHELDENQEYYLGVFLVGAYQETLGDLHNLMGDTNILSIRIGSEGEIQYDRELEGDSVADVLSYVEYDTKAMLVRLRKLAETAVCNGKLNARERRAFMDAYEIGMRGYTYFER